MKMPKKVIFMGTTDFAAAILTTLLAMSDLKIVGVVCQPDRPIGRKRVVQFSPVKQIALDEQIQIFQPNKIGAEWEKLQLLDPDVILTCAYGQFLPAKILAIAKIAAINVHASLLPSLRGGAPIHWAIIRDYQWTGITLMQMSQKMDAGAMYVQTKVAIDVNETYISLKAKLIIAAQTAIKNSLMLIIKGQITAIAQDESKTTFGYNILRSDELVNWNQSARLVSCHVRGLYDVPIAYTLVNQFIFKIHQLVVTNQIATKPPGTIMAINTDGIFVATSDYQVVIKTIQPEGRKAVSTANFFGNSQQPLTVGMQFFVKT